MSLTRHGGLYELSSLAAFDYALYSKSGREMLQDRSTYTHTGYLEFSQHGPIYCMGFWDSLPVIIRVSWIASVFRAKFMPRPACRMQ
jgi:hypothetical protein